MTDCIVAFHADASVFGRVVCSSEPDSGRRGFFDVDRRHHGVSHNLSQDRVSPFFFAAANLDEADWHREAGWAMVSCLHRYLDLDPCLARPRLERPQGASNDLRIYVRDFLWFASS